MLSNPHRHAETDGSGMVRSLDQGDRIKEVGDFHLHPVHGHRRFSIDIR